MTYTVSSGTLNSYYTIPYSVLTAIVPGEPGLVGFIVAKDDGRLEVVVTTGAVKLQSNNHQPTNQHPMLYRLDVLTVAQPTVLEH